MAYTRGHVYDRGYGREETALYGTCASWHGPPRRRTRSGRYAASLRLDRGACRRVPWAVGRCASGGSGVGGQCPNADPFVADGLAGAAQRLCAALYRHCRERRPGPGARVGRVSETPFTFEYGAAARLVRGVYLSVTLTSDDRTHSLVLPID